MSATSFALLLALASAPASPAKAAHAASAPAAKPLDVQADHLTVKTKDNRGIWKGHVHAVRAASADQPQLDLRCDEMVTDFEGEDKLQKATCTGNVEVVQGDRMGWGEVAVYDSGSATVVVTGNPHGQQGPNKFAGSELTFLVEADRVEIKDAKLLTHAPAQLGEAKPAPKPGGAK